MDLEYPTLIYLKINKEPVNAACKFANNKKNASLNLPLMETAKGDNYHWFDLIFFLWKK